MHPEYPWVLSVDRDGKVSVWDFERNVQLLSKSIAELILSAAESSVEVNSSNSTGKSQGFLSSRLINDQDNDDTLFTERSLSPSSTPNTKQKEISAPTRLCFIDINALFWSNKIPTTSSTSSTPINYNSDQKNNSFHQLGQIMIVCESIILFYNFISHKAMTLSVTDLTKPPTSLEFMSHDICAVGCADGMIR